MFAPKDEGESLPHTPPFELDMIDCAVCSSKPDKVVSRYYNSDEESWSQLGGREGREYFCAKHPDQWVGDVWDVFS